MTVVGARPNFVKAAPIHAALVRDSGFAPVLVHTGQHYDDALSEVFFEELGLPKPDVNLNIGSGTHARQTAAVMTAFEPVLVKHRPDLLIVVGDVNSTLACALVASKLGVPIAHVEAGLRSFDRTMPEEINRILTDQVSDLLFTTEQAAANQLQREGLDPARIHFVGNVMIDTLLAHRERARARGVPERLGVTTRGYGLLTLHRPGNVDHDTTFDRLMCGIARVAEDVPILFPVHPRTRAAVARSGRVDALVRAGRLHLLEPLGYIEFLALMDASAVVLTDSGGIQEETTILGVPCLTLRENTERPITVTHGTNRLVGTDPERISNGWRAAQSGAAGSRTPPLWDGAAAARIVDVLGSVMLARPRRSDALATAAATDSMLWSDDCQAQGGF